MDGFGVVFFESLRRGWLPEVLRNVDAGLPIVDLEPSASKVVVELLPSFLGGILCVVNKPCRESGRMSGRTWQISWRAW